MVLCVKVPLKHAQKVKRFLVDGDMFSKNYFFKKDKTHIFFPIRQSKKSTIKSKFDFVSFENQDLKPTKKSKNLKTKLATVLSPEEQKVLRTAFDSVGTIAILEIPEPLVKREKLIAETLLKTNKNIKTVLKKVGFHGTEFRTQKMKYLAGEKTKETIHKELGISLKLNVETVYFSPRLSTERKRIAELVKDDEDILVMFSGCAPYPCVFAKNTNARSITGIELNPEGHRYGLENLKLNKIHNTLLINGDVNKVIPDLYHNIVGLKSADIDYELEKRLVHHPVLMEIHLFDDDLWKGRPKLEKTIQSLQKKGIQVVLHMPFGHGKKRYSLGQADISAELKMFKVLGELCKKYHIKAVVHPTQNIGIAEDEAMLVDHIKFLEPYYDYFYFENVTSGLFVNARDIVRIGKKAGIKNMCIDTCHLFIAYQNNRKIERHVKKIQKHFNTYFHLNDHDYKTHSCEIGKGFVDILRILPYVHQGVTEICNKDERNPKEMIRSYLTVEHIHRKYDRVVMPLPKSAKEFLDAAITSAKKGAIIHFYDFLHVDEFEKAHEKIGTACKRNKRRFKILRTVRCGQHAPKVFRICVDVKLKN